MTNVNSYPETELLADSVLHEMADKEGDLVNVLLEHIQTRPTAQRTALAVELEHLATLDDESRGITLKKIDLGWQFDDDRDFFSTLSLIAETLSDLD